jgi:small subunit ribosomal protein S8
MGDPISDMLTRIRNAQLGSHRWRPRPAEASIAQVLKDGISRTSLRETKESPSSDQPQYYAGKPVIEKLERVSRPGLRIYRGKAEIPPVMNGLGVAIVSTSRGVMTDRKARGLGVGGEVLCIVA